MSSPSTSPPDSGDRDTIVDELEPVAERAMVTVPAPPALPTGPEFPTLHAPPPLGASPRPREPLETLRDDVDG